MGPAFEKNFSPLQIITAEQSTFVFPECTVSYPTAATTSSFISGPLGGVSEVHCQIHPRAHYCTPLLQVSYRIFPSSALWIYMRPPIMCQVKSSIGTWASQYNVHSILLIKISLSININLRNLERRQAAVRIRVHSPKTQIKTRLNYYRSLQS